MGILFCSSAVPETILKKRKTVQRYKDERSARLARTLQVGSFLHVRDILLVTLGFVDCEDPPRGDLQEG